MITVITLINIVLNVGLNLYLIPKYGLFTAFATLLAGGSTGILSFISPKIRANSVEL